MGMPRDPNRWQSLCPPTLDLMLNGLQHRGDKQDQARQKENEHCRDHRHSALGSAFEFLPNEDTPDSSDHRAALPESVCNRWACGLRCDEIGGRARAVDQTAQDPNQVVLESSLAEVVGEADLRSFERMRHQITVED